MEGQPEEKGLDSQPITLTLSQLPEIGSLQEQPLSLIFNSQEAVPPATPHVAGSPGHAATDIETPGQPNTSMGHEQASVASPLMSHAAHVHNAGYSPPSIADAHALLALHSFQQGHRPFDGTPSPAAFTFVPSLADGAVVSQPPPARVHPSLMKPEHRNSRASRRGPMDEMRQLVRILVKLAPSSMKFLALSVEGGGGNRVTEEEIKDYLRRTLGTEAPQPEWGLPEGWGQYLSELFSWALDREITREEAMACARRLPGRSWEAVDEELARLGLYPHLWPLPLTKLGIQQALADVNHGKTLEGDLKVVKAEPAGGGPSRSVLPLPAASKRPVSDQLDIDSRVKRRKVRLPAVDMLLNELECYQMALRYIEEASHKAGTTPTDSMGDLIVTIELLNTHLKKHLHPISPQAALAPILPTATSAAVTALAAATQQQHQLAASAAATTASQLQRQGSHQQMLLPYHPHLHSAFSAMPVVPCLRGSDGQVTPILSPSQLEALSFISTPPSSQDPNAPQPPACQPQVAFVFAPQPLLLPHAAAATAAMSGLPLGTAASGASGALADAHAAAGTEAALGTSLVKPTAVRATSAIALPEASRSDTPSVDAAAVTPEYLMRVGALGTGFMPYSTQPARGALAGRTPPEPLDLRPEGQEQGRVSPESAADGNQSATSAALPPGEAMAAAAAATGTNGHAHAEAAEAAQCLASASDAASRGAAAAAPQPQAEPPARGSQELRSSLHEHLDSAVQAVLLSAIGGAGAGVAASMPHPSLPAAALKGPGPVTKPAGGSSNHAVAARQQQLLPGSGAPPPRPPGLPVPHPTMPTPQHPAADENNSGTAGQAQHKPAAAHPNKQQHQQHQQHQQQNQQHFDQAQVLRHPPVDVQPPSANAKEHQRVQVLTMALKH